MHITSIDNLSLSEATASIESGLLYAGHEVFWFVKISQECLKQQPACVNCFFEASHYRRTFFPSLPVSVLTH